jgi:hypothetical protein
MIVVRVARFLPNSQMSCHFRFPAIPLTNPVNYDDNWLRCVLFGIRSGADRYVRLRPVVRL